MRPIAICAVPLLLAACDPASTSSCDADAPAQSFPTCVIPLDDPALEQSWVDVGEAELELQRTLVVEQGTGAPGADTEASARFAECGLPDEPATWWALLADEDGAHWLAGASTAGSTPALEVGQQLGLRWSWEENSPFAGHYGGNELTLLDFEEALVAWVANGWGIGTMSVPSLVSLSAGEEIFRERTECYVSVGYALDVSIGDSAASLCFGESASLDGFTVTHGGLTNAEDLSCSETSGDSFQVAVVRGG